jgi:hypothetical protein
VATGLSLVGILAYLAFRFEFSFGVGAVVATIHDLLITLAFLALFRYDMTLNVVAAILTIEYEVQNVYRRIAHVDDAGRSLFDAHSADSDPES